MNGAEGLGTHAMTSLRALETGSITCDLACACFVLHHLIPAARHWVSSCPGPSFPVASCLRSCAKVQHLMTHLASSRWLRVCWHIDLKDIACCPWVHGAIAGALSLVGIQGIEKVDKWGGTRAVAVCGR